MMDTRRIIRLDELSSGVRLKQQKIVRLDGYCGLCPSLN